MGGLQAFGGLCEATAGGALALTTSWSVVGPVVGCGIMAHGFDHYIAGMNAVFSGNPTETMSARAMQQTGMSPEAAHFVDGTVSIIATMGAIHMAKTGVRMAGSSMMVNQTKVGSAFNVSKTASQRGNDTITLYRAVKPDELIDIQKTGVFRNLGHAEGKYFTTSIESASSYAKQAVNGLGDPPYTVVKTQATSNILEGIQGATVDGGIPAWVIPDQKLEGLVPEIMNWMGVPK